MNQQALHKNWNRSYKEDTESEMVFRLDDFRFPPPTDRFGRASINLGPDNRFSQRGNIFRKEGNLTANDSFSNVNGRWQLEEDSLALYADPGEEAYTFKIVSLEEDKLVVARQ